MKLFKYLLFVAIVNIVFVASVFSQQSFVATLNGVQETPPNSSAGIGVGNVTVNAAGTIMTVNMSFSGLGTAAFAAHIHLGAIGSAGGVVFGLSGVPAATSGAIPSQSFAITAAELATLQSGQYYFNIHTSGFGGGEIRGQILAPTAASASIHGRLLTPTGRGLMNATIVLTNTNSGEVFTARSTSLGYFNFRDLESGDFYVLNVKSKRYVFETRSFTLDENIDDMVITGSNGLQK
jgi:CHRD domain/Carboxypeptidase regulatory-like domain